MSALKHLRRRCRDDRGDTLIEVLFAVVIIALAAGPLIGALLESIAASAEHQGLATTGTLLESFAETAVSEIQTSPRLGTAYQATTTPSYRLLSNPSKTSGPDSTTQPTLVSVFVTGFTPTDKVNSFSVTVGTSPAPIPKPLTTYVKIYGTGDARITFAIPHKRTLPPPTTPTTPYQIKVSDSTGSAESLPGTGFKVSSSAPSNQGTKTPYKAYEIEVASITCWTTARASPQFVSCSTANHLTLQYLTFSAKGPSGILGTLGVVVRDPSHT